MEPPDDDFLGKPSAGPVFERECRAQHEKFESYDRQRRIYENSFPRGDCEISCEAYLRRLGRGERNALAYLFTEVFCDTLFRYGGPIMALAVGTTAFPYSYWAGLEKYLRENDPSKLPYVERRGEDIDIQLSPDDCNFYAINNWLRLAEIGLGSAGLKYSKEETKRDDGTSYLTVPEAYREREGQGVIRYKRDAYFSPAFSISLADSRPVHLIFDCIIGEVKVKRERLEGYPFSLLFRGGGVWDFKDAVARVNAQKELFW